MDNLVTIAEQFRPHGRVIDIQRLGNGNINNTFLVTLDYGDCKHFVLQSINPRIFPSPDRIMKNLRTLTDHVSRRPLDIPELAGRRWEIPVIMVSRDRKDFWQDEDGLYWRALSYIENARSFETVRDVQHAAEIGHALGLFHSIVSDLAPERLEDTLEGFHITPRYLHQFKNALATYGADRSAEVDYCMDAVDAGADLAGLLEDARARGRLFLRPVHGDPKVNNILIDDLTGQAVSIVDLDTFKPGLIHYDIGDCIRSGCNPAGEETEDPDAVFFDPDLCDAMLRGYVSAARDFLTVHDYDHLYDAIRLIPYELGLRFFTDHLHGNVYFKVRHEKHNLARAIVQFRLAESIKSQETVIRAMIENLR